MDRTAQMMVAFQEVGSMAHVAGFCEYTRSADYRDQQPNFHKARNHRDINKASEESARVQVSIRYPNRGAAFVLHSSTQQFHRSLKTLTIKFLKEDGDCGFQQGFLYQTASILITFTIDSSAAQISGVAVSGTAESWDTQLSRNVNDDELSPGMTENPVDQSGATDMLFCLSRFCSGKHLVRVRGPAALGNPNTHSSDVGKEEEIVQEAEAEIENKIL
ncbi:hypothetical protein BDW69DRAFT_190601 [Aspergillus filifer]